MARQVEAKTVMGISVGDTVSTSYGTGPYRVATITDPKLWEGGKGHLSVSIWPYPVCTIVLAPAEWNMAKWPRESELGWLNWIHREGDRYFDCGGSEIFVKKAADAPTLQVGLFATAEKEPEPYPYQEGVDYYREGEIWHCPECGTDFNAVQTEPYAPIHCKWAVSSRIFMMGLDGDTRNPLLRYLGFKREDTHHV